MVTKKKKVEDILEYFPDVCGPGVRCCKVYTGNLRAERTSPITCSRNPDHSGPHWSSEGLGWHDDPTNAASVAGRMSGRRLAGTEPKSAKKPVTVKKVVKKVKAPKIRKTYVAFVLDASGSMDGVRDETISTFNAQVDAITKTSTKIDTRVCLTTFDTYVQRVMFNEPVKNLKKLTREDYVPQNYTALYDGVGETLESLLALKDINDDDVSVLMLIISDGEENSSRRFTQHQIAERVKHLTGTNRWTFTYLGANQDLTQVSKNLNINIQNMSVFAANAAGVATASASMTRGLLTYYTTLESGQGASVDSFYSPVEPDKDNKNK